MTPPKVVPGAHDVETFTGLYVNVQNPQPEDIDVVDIAHALANTCRYGGHSSDYYSVAEHAVLCSWYIMEKYEDPVLALAALHHDDAEAYLGDIPRPIKSLLGPAYGELTELMDRAVVIGLNLPVGSVRELHADKIREADNWALLQEAARLLPSKGSGWNNSPVNWDLDDGVDPDGVQPPPEFAFSLRPHAAEALYLSTHRALLQEVRDAE